MESERERAEGDRERDSLKKSGRKKLKKACECVCECVIEEDQKRNFLVVWETLFNQQIQKTRYKLNKTIQSIDPCEFTFYYYLTSPLEINHPFLDSTSLLKVHIFNTLPLFS